MVKNLFKQIQSNLMMYQKMRWPEEPSESIARVVLAIEKELQAVDPLVISVYCSVCGYRDCQADRQPGLVTCPSYSYGHYCRKCGERVHLEKKGNCSVPRNPGFVMEDELIIQILRNMVQDLKCRPECAAEIIDSKAVQITAYIHGKESKCQNLRSKS